MNTNALPLSPRVKRSALPHWLWPVFWSLLAAGGLTWLCYTDETAREVAWDTTRTVLGLLFSPFILESTSILVGIIILMIIRHYQDKRDGDGWVYLATQEPEDKTLPRALTERLQSVVLSEKPAEPDDRETRHAVIEGYLELGMSAQALGELQSDERFQDLESELLTVRVKAANLDTEEALAMLHAAAAKSPEKATAIAGAALEIGSWITAHLHRPDLAQLWRNEAERIVGGPIL